MTADTEPWLRLSSRRYGRRRRWRKQVQSNIVRLFVREQQRGSRRKGNSENRLPSMTSGQIKWRAHQSSRRTRSEWVESCAAGVHGCGP